MLSKCHRVHLTSYPLWTSCARALWLNSKNRKVVMIGTHGEALVLGGADTNKALTWRGGPHLHSGDSHSQPVKASLDKEQQNVRLSQRRWQRHSDFKSQACSTLPNTHTPMTTLLSWSCPPPGGSRTAAGLSDCHSLWWDRSAMSKHCVLLRQTHTQIYHGKGHHNSRLQIIMLHLWMD